MRKDDLTQVHVIDREAFPTQRPAANYTQELQNRLARYIVVTEPAPEPSPAPLPGAGLLPRLRRWLSGADSAVTAGERLLGFAGIWVIIDEAHVTNIAVNRAYRGRGLGGLLLLNLIEVARGLNTAVLTLEVRASNLSARKLYEKYGFAEVGLRRGYYNDNREDAVLMTSQDLNSPEYKEDLARLNEALQEKVEGKENPGR